MFSTFYFLKQKITQLTTGHCSWSVLHGFRIWNESYPFKPTVHTALSQVFLDPLIPFSLKGSMNVSTLTRKELNLRKTESAPNFISGGRRTYNLHRELPVKSMFFHFAKPRLPEHCARQAGHQCKVQSGSATPLLPRLCVCLRSEETKVQSQFVLPSALFISFILHIFQLLVLPEKSLLGVLTKISSGMWGGGITVLLRANFCTWVLCRYFN